MNLNRRLSDQTRHDDSTTIIFHGIKIKGEISGSHNIVFNAEFEGKIDLSALLVIGKTGKITGEVKAKNVIIDGEFEGSLVAGEKVEIKDSGKYKGDIVSPSIMVSDQAFFEGNVKMQKEDGKSPVKTFTEKRREDKEK